MLGKIALGKSSSMSLTIWESTRPRRGLCGLSLRPFPYVPLVAVILISFALTLLASDWPFLNNKCVLI